TADIANLNSDVAMASQAHKTLIMDEAWLYKDYVTGNFDAAGHMRANQDGSANEQKVTTFDFYAPLDAQFITEMTDYARAHGVAYLSFFDARSYFAYLPWTPELEADAYAEVARQVNTLAAANMNSGIVTESGVAFEQAVLSSPRAAAS
ncbi:MAG: hypothetical protein JO247_08050, partial [Chloroflexi bacterium]|nr:hypothetical protein [Chloroflexota bacterium]